MTLTAHRRNERLWCNLSATPLTHAATADQRKSKRDLTSNDKKQAYATARKRGNWQKRKTSRVGDNCTYIGRPKRQCIVSLQRQQRCDRFRGTEQLQGSTHVDRHAAACVIATSGMRTMLTHLQARDICRISNKTLQRAHTTIGK